ncbi:MAG: FdhF/YdeP family oxidoreductase [Galactobacter sp.]|uniref:FdhF/YdeP family oxidoreductase n=1 Tax=Galactobacter sp. TaxID=2676125 RepID=UPI0025C69202|nr:FdhF/YdeP family oxidoreductase [Galactobacter sp.]
MTSVKSDSASEQPEYPTAVGLLSKMPRQGGYGPTTKGPVTSSPYHHPAAGWGAAKSVGRILMEQRLPMAGSKAMFQLNHNPGGYDCPGCAWPDDQKGLKLDFCENGMKHVTWEMTGKRTTPQFLALHSVTELSTWTDYDLENEGRLTHPMSYNAETDHYEPISWDDAFSMIGDELRKLDSPDQASFYTSGRLSNEGTFLYQLFAREFGTNNLPDCSNMCHEASGRALKASIGTGKGTVDMHDWETTDALFLLGVNAASNAPRMLTALAEAHDRGAQVVHINPLREIAATKTTVPHEIMDMARFKTHETSTMNLQVRPSGDFALMRGIAKVVFEAAANDPGVLAAEFLANRTTGLDEYRAVVEATPWEELVHQSGLTEEEIRAAGQVYLDSPRTIIAWCLGVSQQKHAVDTIREISNVLLLKGNIAREGAGPSPIRGHSNVQGNRTCGINHHADPVLLDAVDRECGIVSPRHHGLDTVQTIKAMNSGAVKVFVGMGGNFVLAAPDTEHTAEGLAKCELTVQVSTKLNRSHLVHGKKALILPCLGRTEKDLQAAGEQGVTVEDAFSMVHVSYGKRRPASEHLKSEPAIICEIAKATLPNTVTPWDTYMGDYSTIRDIMARVLPGFEDFNERIKPRGGFRIPQPAREGEFVTASGLAEFSAAELPNQIPEGADALVLQTMRSHDQWNTTIYSANDRYRGVKNGREVVFMHQEDMRERGISEGSLVDIVATSLDGSKREVNSYTALKYDTPRGSAAGYMPEMNALIGIEDYSRQSDQPLMKSVEVRITPAR